MSSVKWITLTPIFVCASAYQPTHLRHVRRPSPDRYASSLCDCRALAGSHAGLATSPRCGRPLPARRSPRAEFKPPLELCAAHRVNIFVQRVCSKVLVQGPSIWWSQAAPTHAPTSGGELCPSTATSVEALRLHSIRSCGPYDTGTQL
jgi:hypothetical protein